MMAIVDVASVEAYGSPDAQTREALTQCGSRFNRPLPVLSADSLLVREGEGAGARQLIRARGLKMRSDNNVYILVRLAIRDGQDDALKTISEELVAATAKEAGMLNYERSLSEDGKTCYVLEQIC